tara:strand:+ start:316 stop:882 length:567 start_codon:yes stop_codon:yes gene_type:complete
MDFETDKDIEDEMTQLMDHMLIPMLEGTGEVPMTGLMFPDRENISDEMKEQMTADPNAKAMFIVPNLGMEKQVFYKVLRDIARENKVRNTMFFSDSWLSQQDATKVESGDMVMPSQDPNRVDALTLHYVNTDENGILLKSAMMAQIYENKDGKVVLKKRRFHVSKNDVNSGNEIHGAIADALSYNDWA